MGDMQKLGLFDSNMNFIYLFLPKVHFQLDELTWLRAEQGRTQQGALQWQPGPPQCASRGWPVPSTHRKPPAC